jgi:hypothetical protein
MTSIPKNAMLILTNLLKKVSEKELEQPLVTYIKWNSFECIICNRTVWEVESTIYAYMSYYVTLYVM